MTKVEMTIRAITYTVVTTAKGLAMIRVPYEMHPEDQDAPRSPESPGHVEVARWEGTYTEATMREFFIPIALDDRTRIPR
jgi:hypothetical protein